MQANHIPGEIIRIEWRCEATIETEPTRQPSQKTNRRQKNPLGLGNNLCAAAVRTDGQKKENPEEHLRKTAVKGAIQGADHSSKQERTPLTKIPKRKPKKNSRSKVGGDGLRATVHTGAAALELAPPLESNRPVDLLCTIFRVATRMAWSNRRKPNRVHLGARWTKEGKGSPAVGLRRCWRSFWGRLWFQRAVVV